MRYEYAEDEYPFWHQYDFWESMGNIRFMTISRHERHNARGVNFECSVE